MKLIFQLILFLLFIGNLEARPIISGISNNEINIDTKFTGAEVLLFGAKDESGDLIVNIRGPKKNYLINRKGKILGVWHNEKRLKIKDIYSYYSFFSVKDSSKNNSDLIRDLEIGKKNINFDISGSVEDYEKIDFEVEFTKILEKKELYLANPEKIKFLDETLFKVMLSFPKNIGAGVYTVEIYLIEDNNLLAFQSIPIYVNQVGFSASIHNMAYQRPFLYGVLAVFIAVIAGWFANFAFTRFFGK